MIAEYQDCVARGDDKRAKQIADKIVRSNGGLVNRVVQKYSPFLHQSRTTQWEDLFQSGMIGLFKAIGTFNPDRGAFSTYATFKILHEVQCEVRRDRLISFPKNNGKAPVEWTTDFDNIDIEEDQGAAEFFTSVMQREDLVPILCRIENPDEREAIISICSGVTIAETSKQLGIRVSDIHAAMVTFQEAIERYGSEHGEN